MSKFQIALTAIFAVFILIGVGLFAFSGRNSSSVVSHVTIWGTMQPDDFSDFIKETSLAGDKTISLTYIQKSELNFDNDFIQALARGEGPDVFFLPQDSILKHQDKIFPIPYDNYSLRLFKDTFIEEGELYLVPEGILALPFTVDPLVMYWNRTLFANAGLTQPPATWDKFFELTEKFNKKDAASNIERTALALGEFSNILYAKEILGTLVMQAGSPIVARDESGTHSVLSGAFDFSVPPAITALNFYTDFANPVRQYYSWNRSLPSSQNFFLGGNSATYFGFASEIFNLQAKNPNLNFDVALLPQPNSDRATKSVFGRMNALAISRMSKDVSGAFKFVTSLTSAQSIAALVKYTNLPPVRRDLLALKPSDAYSSVFYDSAIRAHAWLDPDKNATSGIFKEMIESVTSGRSLSSEAVGRASDQIDVLLQ